MWSFRFGCGQSVPHNTRSGKVSTMRLGERHHVAIGPMLQIRLALQRLRAGDRQPLGATDLAPDVGVLAHELHEQLELRPVHRQAHVGPAHVIDDHGRGQRGEEIPQLGQVDGLEVDHHVPAERGNARGDLHQLVPGREIDQALDEVEAHAAHPCRVHGLQVGIADRALDRRHPARLAAAARPAHRPSPGCRRRGRWPAPPRCGRSQGDRAAHRAAASTHRRACTCAPVRTGTRRRGRTHGSARRRCPPAP